jgi:hypothetical protein
MEYNIGIAHINYLLKGREINTIHRKETIKYSNHSRLGISEERMNALTCGRVGTTWLAE